MEEGSELSGLMEDDKDSVALSDKPAGAKPKTKTGMLSHSLAGYMPHRAMHTCSREILSLSPGFNCLDLIYSQSVNVGHYNKLSNLRIQVASSDLHVCRFKIHPCNTAVWLYTLCHQDSRKFQTMFDRSTFTESKHLCVCHKNGLSFKFSTTSYHFNCIGVGALGSRINRLLGSHLLSSLPRSMSSSGHTLQAYSPKPVFHQSASHGKHCKLICRLQTVIRAVPK